MTTRITDGDLQRGPEGVAEVGRERLRPARRVPPDTARECDARSEGRRDAAE
ncbi:hypothetical protein SAMN02745121_01767 [Nannocystis exedens]|uniref:Uncharacterized protein n=1 Tax=Nannocystis exedens TaxID=54 RepID=A0A1I1VSE6_9BACT|nr:hypothetical protein NAEX_05736 [Nannocystis exedens]SFD83953.1 hypothetical protein SAMN02745121_01767 [Nannocystis exedens]